MTTELNQAPASENQAPATPPAAVPATPPVTPPEPASIPAPEVKPFEETGDPALDVTFSFLNGVGISADDAAVEAARSGDFTQIEAKLKALGDKAKGYEKHLALAKGVYERESKAAEAKANETLKAVHDIVGGQERWEAIRTWAAAQATPAEREQINAAFAQGGFAAKAAAEKLATLFAKANPASKLPASAVKPDAQVPGGASLMTSKEYAKAVDALARKHNGRDISNLPEYQALRQQRSAARAAGVK